MKNKNDEIIDKAIEWINSPKGQKALDEAYEQAKKETDKLEKASQIDPKKLERPCTI